MVDRAPEGEDPEVTLTIVEPEGRPRRVGAREEDAAEGEPAPEAPAEDEPTAARPGEQP